MSAVVINLRVGGIADVRSALRSVEQEVVRVQRAQNAGSQASARTRATAAKAGTKAETSEMQKAAQQAAAYEKQKTSIRENSVKYASKLAKQLADAETKAAQKAVDDKIAAEQNWARRREQIQTRSALMAGPLGRSPRAPSRSAERSQRRMPSAAARPWRPSLVRPP